MGQPHVAASISDLPPSGPTDERLTYIVGERVFLPANHENTVINHITIYFSWMDRLRILFGRVVDVSVFTPVSFKGLDQLRTGRSNTRVNVGPILPTRGNRGGFEKRELSA